MNVFLITRLRKRVTLKASTGAGNYAITRLRALRVMCAMRGDVSMRDVLFFTSCATA